MALNPIAGAQPPATWSVGNKLPVAFPYVDCRCSIGNRLVEHARYLREGAKYDDTGARPVRFDFTIRWFNGNQEPGIRGDIQYPDEVLRLIDAAKVHETGWLEVPTYGKRRCRLESLVVHERSTEPDMAEGTAAFVEDNEEGLTAFQAPSAISILRPRAEAVYFALQKEGMWSSDCTSLQFTLNQVANMLNAPAEYATELREHAMEGQRSIARIHFAFFSSADVIARPAAGMGLGPRCAGVGIGLILLEDALWRLVLSLPGRARPRLLRFFNPIGLLQVAVLVGQPLERLLELNPGLEDPSFILPRWPIRVDPTTAAIPGTF
jgi:hypothetical protein